MMEDRISIADKLELITEHWRPGIVGTYNENKIVVVKVLGEFEWHSHAETDDLFLVVSGRLQIDLRDRTVELGPGELFVVPRGVEHRPRADVETAVLLIEPLWTRNTGDDGERSELIAPERWI
jgi:mannose-6-phosphate isomerase-like protein (cupin superfamily)